MEAVVRTGGKQYFVQKGDLIETELTQDEIGSEIVFDDVLLLSDSKSMVSDPKVLKSAKVKAKVVSHIKGKKIKVFKFRRRQNSKTLNGHLPLEHGSDRRETLGKRVSDDSRHFIFQRPTIFLVFFLSSSLAPTFFSRILRFGGARIF